MLSTLICAGTYQKGGDKGSRINIPASRSFLAGTREKTQKETNITSTHLFDHCELSTYSEPGTGLGNWKYRPATTEMFLQLLANTVCGETAKQTIAQAIVELPVLRDMKMSPREL